MLRKEGLILKINVLFISYGVLVSFFQLKSWSQHHANNQHFYNLAPRGLLFYRWLLLQQTGEIWERIIMSNSQCSNLFPGFLIWERGWSMPSKNVHTRYDVWFFFNLLEYRWWRISFFGPQGVSRTCLMFKVDWTVVNGSQFSKATHSHFALQGSTNHGNIRRLFWFRLVNF